jgi:hypothetical protein
VPLKSSALVGRLNLRRYSVIRQASLTAVTNPRANRRRLDASGERLGAMLRIATGVRRSVACPVTKPTPLDTRFKRALPISCEFLEPFNRCVASPSRPIAHHVTRTVQFG